MDKKFEVITTYSNYNGDGRLYPDTFQVVEVKGGYQVWDTTGWTGYQTCDPFMVADFPVSNTAYPSVQRQAATICAWALSLHNDPMEVFDAAVKVVNKEEGAFKNLKGAVAWQDTKR